MDPRKGRNGIRNQTKSNEIQNVNIKFGGKPRQAQGGSQAKRP